MYLNGLDSNVSDKGNTLSKNNMQLTAGKRSSEALNCPLYLKNNLAKNPS